MYLSCICTSFHVIYPANALRSLGIETGVTLWPPGHNRKYVLYTTVSTGVGKRDLSESV